MDATDPGTSARAVIDRLGLEPLVPEGGWFRRTYTGAATTAIHFLVTPEGFSALHRMRSSDEIYLFHAGAPLSMLLLDPGTGRVREVLLGPDVTAGQVVHQVVPAGTWQGSRTTGDWTLVTAVVTPGFEWTDFELADRAALAGCDPGAAERVAALLRD
ncbi:cupin domain-containing protein [Nakamurella endophytica]|uniref:DUF985 domain-containing protein n=1 Tax=Nakamurella endophytica TaxID=1748367 RepID=A0A917SNJ0_9ACTN|nr:cupin domain-containing protein [Nakamurella endophytica]GGL89452.1 hypothetical protein GCM10011594_06320 [Nakamurella endophytica]